MAAEQSHPAIAAADYRAYMKYGLEQVQQFPPEPTNSCVEAVLVNANKNETLSTKHQPKPPDDKSTNSGTIHTKKYCLKKLV